MMLKFFIDILFDKVFLKYLFVILEVKCVYELEVGVLII